MKNIGPTFVDELKAAGIPLNGIAWGADGAITFREDVLQPTRDAVLAVYAAHDPMRMPSTPLNNGVALEQSRLDALRKDIDSQIGSLSGDQQVVLRNMLKLIDKEV